MWRTLHYLPKEAEGLRLEADNLVQAYRKRPRPVFTQADFTQQTDLPDSYFDLAYCERVLYHIACEDTKPMMNHTRAAVQEMARVIVPGGLVVAIEPCTCSPDDDTPLRLTRFFSQLGLVELEVKNRFSPESKSVYAFVKPS